MKHLDEGTIHAWLDGALSPDESARVESHVNSCAECSALVAEARGLVAASSRILSSLDAVPAGVLPGTDSTTDQLAALRARRQAAKRAWWRDNRFVAAASLVLVAGVSSVVWRSTQVETVATASDSAVSVLAPPPAAAPNVIAAPTPSEPAAAESRVGNAKVAASQPLRDNAPTRVARQASDSFADVKVMSASVASGAREASSVAESRQATDSTKALARAEQSAFERKVQQAAQSVPTPPRIIPEQQQAGAAASPPPSLAPRAERNRSALNAAVADAVAPVPSLAGACIELRRALGPGRLSAEPDSVRLLDEAAPERGDPSWRRARYEGTPPDAGILSWRQVDSVTVELHSRRSSADSSSNVLRFLSSPLAVRQAGDRNLELGGLPGVRVAGVGVAFAWRIVCR